MLLQLFVLSLSGVVGFAPITTTTNNNVSRYSRQWNMFTGIIEEMGTVVDLVERDDMELWDGSTGKGTELTVQGSVVLDGAYLGCSIAVNGVCLTATSLEEQVFKVGLAPETMRRTYLGSLQSGDSVNLERASEIGQRNSGHFVQGHVDGVGTIVDKYKDGDSLYYNVETTPELMKYIVEKGFIAIDGTSLTVCSASTGSKNEFTFMLVEYTQKKIILPQKAVGSMVNIEVDVLSKYSESTVNTIMVPQLEQLESKLESMETSLTTKIDDLESKLKTLQLKLDKYEQ